MTAPEADPEVTWTDTVWRASDGLKARIYQPTNPTVPGDASPAGAAVIDIHGGAWNALDRTIGHRYNTMMAAAGYTVVAVDFRDGRQARHPVANDDIAAAISWVGDHPDLGVDRDRIALTGSSSGGHLALHVAITEVPVRAVAALWPPVDPLARYRYAASMIGQPVPEGNRLDAAGLVASTEAYFGDAGTMGRASIAEIVRSGRATQFPPVLLVEAGEDLNVPVSMLDELEQAYTAAGGRLDRRLYPGEIHGFGHGTHDGAVRFGHDLVDWLTDVLG